MAGVVSDARLVAMVTTLADELAARVEAEYPPSTRGHFAMLRRYVQGMELVHEARALVADVGAPCGTVWDENATRVLR